MEKRKDQIDITTHEDKNNPPYAHTPLKLLYVLIYIPFSVELTLLKGP
jgi:hypothetical protein